MELELTVVQPPTDLGFIAAFAITDQMIHIAGGTSLRAPTLLASSNARHFERQSPPRALGLRDVVVHGDAVWVCGEYGQLAVSRDRGATWKLFDTATEVCLHALALAPDGAMWVAGDRGYAARVVADQLHRVTLDTTVRFTGVRPLRDEVVLLGYDGTLRRWRAGAVTTAATGTAKPINAFQLTKRGTWIVVGDNGFVARSPDGAWWTRVKTEADADLEAVALFGDMVVIVGDRGRILISGDDGRTWQSQPSELAAHLWAVAPFGDGLLIGGDDGLIAKLAPPGDRTWEDRVNVFGGAKALDLQFAAGPVGFVTKYLASITGRDEPQAAHAEAFTRAYGIAPPPMVVAYYAAAVDAQLADLHVEHDTLELSDRNLFESLVVRPGNALIEAFCGAFRIGHADNGDSFHVELYEWDGPRQVVRYAGDAFSVVADSLDSLVYLAALRGAHRDDKISDDALQIGLRKLAGRTAPTLDPKRRDTEFLFFRSRWISALLQNRLGDVAQLFNADFNQIVPADQLPARYDACERFIPTALYSMWRAYLFDEPELARYLEIGRRHKARLVRDAVALIDELRGGRKQLGAIDDIQAHLAAFRALDLDPRRAEARKREADERAAAEARAKALANEELDAIEPTRWNELAWRWLNNGIAHRQLLVRLDATSPSAAQLAELDELRGDKAYATRLGLVRIAEELSSELEAVLVGSLVRDDTLANALPPAAARSEDDEIPGWAAIDRALAPVYKGADPHAHFGSLLPHSLGGSRGPIQGISVYLRDEPVPHFHFVTYGFSDLMRKETDDPEISGFGFELTFRLARAIGNEKVPDWSVTMLESLGRYVFRTGDRFAAGHKLRPNPGTLTHATDTALVALVFTDDPELGDIHSQFGKARFVQVVGITDDEYKLIQEWSVGGLIELLRRRLPVLVTDVARRSVLADAATSIVVKKRVAIEGSDEGDIHADHLELATGEGLRVELGALAAQVLPRAIRGRIRHGRMYTIHGPEGVKLHLGPATTAPRLTVAEREVTFELTPALASAVEDKLRGGLVGDYRFDHGLRVIVTPSFVTESSGLAREVHGIADPEEAKRLIAEHNRSVAAIAQAADTDDADDADEEPEPEPDDDDGDDDDEPPPSPIRVKKALAMTTRALALAPGDGDVQFTHAMLLLDGDTAGLDTLDTLIAVLPSFDASVRINVATRMGRAEHPRFDEVVDAVLSDVSPAKVVGERSFTVSATDAAAAYGDVGEELFAELAEAILVHAPNRMAKLVPVLPANVTLLAKIAHDAIQADERDHALALYDRVLELPIPDEGEARINYLRSLNNACIQAHAVKAFDAAARIADRAQPFAHENPYIYHSAACAYAAVGDLAKAFHQVKLAVDHDYEHLAKVENDRDLGHLLEWPEFQALFRDWHARQEGN